MKNLFRTQTVNELQSKSFAMAWRIYNLVVGNTATRHNKPTCELIKGDGV